MLPTFIEERLPEEISFGSSGGPMFSTSVFGSASGFEQRNSLWEQSRNKYDIAYGINEKAQMDVVLAFFMNTRGRAIGFRFKDWADYQLTAQEIAVGDSTTSVFQIVKTYVAGAETFTRRIYKPVVGAIDPIEVNGTPLVEGVDYTIDYTTGVVTFVAAPANGESIVVTGEFDVPVRFDTDELPIVHESWLTESVSSIPVLEIRQD